MNHTIAAKTFGRPSRGALSALAGAGFGIVARSVEAILEYQDRARERSQLASLDDRMLRDMGITRLDVAHEAEKPFWRA